MRQKQEKPAQVEPEDDSATPERRTQQQRTEETRNKLIHAAINLISRNGLAGLTMVKVARAAGMTRGAIQYHFATPKELLREVTLEIVRFLTSQVSVAQLQPMPVKTRLNELVDRYWQGYRSETYGVFVEIAVQGRRDPELKHSIEASLKDLELARDEQWLSLFLEFPESNEEKLRWRSLLLDILRGLAVKQMFLTPDEDIDRHFRRARDMYVQHILSGSLTGQG